MEMPYVKVGQEEMKRGEPEEAGKRLANLSTESSHMWRPLLRVKTTLEVP